jgi:hypothetical protein
MVAPHSIVVIDHFERLLDPNSQVLDEDVQQFVALLADQPDAKVIITARRRPDLTFLPAGVLVDAEQPPIGRLDRGKHVENILNDYVNIAILDRSYAVGHECSLSSGTTRAWNMPQLRNSYRSLR